MSASAERLARLALNIVGEPGDPRLTHLVHQLSGQQVWEGLLKQGELRELRDDLGARIRAADPVGLLRTATKAGLRFVIPGDDEWPVQVEDLAFAPALNERAGVPVGLWVRGTKPLPEVIEKSVAMVGSRSSTTYGEEVAANVAMALADSGFNSISGAAFGIDQAAHRGSLVAGGHSVALLSCGVDRPYPKAHAALLDWIADNGAVVSEAPPGVAPTQIRFLARNRLIAALGQGVVVVEAALRSGALNTANWGIGLGRPVMGVPGPITSEPSRGVHQLIRNKDATLVTAAEEIMELVGQVGEYLLPVPREGSRPRDQLSTGQRQVLDAVPVQQPAALDSISRSAGISKSKTDEALWVLHKRGMVHHECGRWRLACEI